MSQNKKRPVTYGKSSFNRARVGLYVPDLDTTSKPPSLRTSSSDGQSATPTIHPLSSVSSIGPPLARTLSGSSLTQGEDAHTAMQGKRRKLLREEAHQRNPDGQTKADCVGRGNPGNHATPEEEDISRTSPGRDENQKASDAIRYSRSDVLPKPKSPKRALPSNSRSARPLKSTPPSSDGKSMASFADAQPKTDTSSPRKRLIDSLGMTNRPPSPLISEPNDDPASLLHERPPQQKFPASGCRTAAEDDTKRRPRNVERSQTTPTSSLSSMLRSSRVTYSRQRSFLNDMIGATDSEPPSVDNEAKLNPGREAHGSFASHIPPEDEDSNSYKAVRTIHELRQAGDNARFREIVDSIFEDIEDQYNSISGRCCSIADLCHKLLNAGFAHRFSEQGFDERLINCIAISSNIVWLSLAFGAFRLIIVGGRASRVFAESLWASILDHSPVLLNSEDDILTLARDPLQGLSKTAQTAVRGLRSQLAPASTSQSLRMSPRLLALECIKSALKLLRENGHTVRHAPTTFLNTLLDLLSANVPDDAERPGHFHVSELIFSVLENYSIVTGPFDDAHCQCLQRLSQLRGLFTSDPRDQMRPTLMSYVRVILNLTNKEPAVCESFALPELVYGLVEIVIRECSDVSKHPAPNENDALNAVILALGTLINLAETTEKARAMLVQSNNFAISPLQQLLKQFSGSARSLDHAHSVLEVHENVVAGYLSILLLTLCLNTEARLLVKKSLDGKGLVLAFSTAEKFLQYHRQVEKENGLAETYEGEFRLTRRLEHIIGQARRLEEDSDELP